MSTIHKHNPPDPNAKCECGLDEGSGMRYSNICPKHDGEYLEIVVDDKSQITQPAEATKK